MVKNILKIKTLGSKKKNKMTPFTIKPLKTHNEKSKA